MDPPNAIYCAVNFTAVVIELYVIRMWLSQDYYHGILYQATTIVSWINTTSPSVVLFEYKQHYIIVVNP